MAGNYFDFGFHQRQALANQLGAMTLHAWLQAQAMRAAQEREKALENYRQLMLALEEQRLGETQRYHKAKEQEAQEQLRELEKYHGASLGLRVQQLRETQRHHKAEENPNKIINPTYFVKTKDGRIGYIDKDGFHALPVGGVEPLTKHGAQPRPLNPGDIVKTEDGRIGFITEDGHFQEIQTPITERPFAPSSLNPELEKLLSPATPTATATPSARMTPRPTPTPSATPMAPRPTPTPSATPSIVPSLPSTSIVPAGVSSLPSTSIVPAGGAPRTVNVSGLGAGMRVDTTPDGRPVYLFTSGKRLALRRETLRELNANP
jgi:hypothetical protein